MAMELLLISTIHYTPDPVKAIPYAACLRVVLNSNMTLESSKGVSLNMEGAFADPDANSEGPEMPHGLLSRKRLKYILTIASGLVVAAFVALTMAISSGSLEACTSLKFAHPMDSQSGHSLLSTIIGNDQKLRSLLPKYIVCKSDFVGNAVKLLTTFFDSHTTLLISKETLIGLITIPDTLCEEREISVHNLTDHSTTCRQLPFVFARVAGNVDCTCSDSDNCVNGLGSTNWENFTEPVQPSLLNRVAFLAESVSVNTSTYNTTTSISTPEELPQTADPENGQDLVGVIQKEMLVRKGYLYPADLKDPAH